MGPLEGRNFSTDFEEIPPFSRSRMLVEKGDDYDLVWLDAEEERIGKL